MWFIIILLRPHQKVHFILLLLSFLQALLAALFPIILFQRNQGKHTNRLHLTISWANRICESIQVSKYVLDWLEANQLGIGNLQDLREFYLSLIVLMIESICVDSPKSFSLVGKLFVYPKVGQSVGKNCKPNVLS